MSMNRPLPPGDAKSVGRGSVEPRNVGAASAPRMDASNGESGQILVAPRRDIAQTLNHRKRIMMELVIGLCH